MCSFCPLLLGHESWQLHLYLQWRHSLNTREELLVPASRKMTTLHCHIHSGMTHSISKEYMTKEKKNFCFKSKYTYVCVSVYGKQHLNSTELVLKAWMPGYWHDDFLCYYIHQISWLHNKLTSETIQEKTNGPLCFGSKFNAYYPNN